LLGAITDGDIRRAMLADLSLDTAVSKVLELKANSSYPNPVTAQANTDQATLLELMRQHRIHQLPLLDDDGRVVGLITLDELLPNKVLPLQAVIMAGGFGTRLRPLTENLPKPMLPVGDKPVMELMINQMREVGIRTVNITTHYLPEKIMDYFGDGQTFGVDINYINENQPLGTAGALSLMDSPQEPLLVINGDILTGVDFRTMFTYHQEHQADLTVGVRQYDIKIPYGVLECDGPIVLGLREKPVYNFFVNAGIYLLQPEVHQYIPTGQRFDMTDLIEHLITTHHKVISFPIVEYWLDIGQHSDYQKAQNDIENETSS
jgi:NDP-sugar pyrophosphorylase family protein